MPNIDIKELDKTTNEVLIQELVDVVYIPGLSSNASSSVGSHPSWTVTNTNSEWDGEVVDGPMLCTSVAQFEAYFGKNPTSIGLGEYQTSAVDYNYIYAKELINAGLPVLYHAIGDATAPISDVLPEALDLINNSSDYQFKYLTLGTYPWITATPSSFVSEWNKITATTSPVYIAAKVANERGDCQYLLDGPDIKVYDASDNATDTFKTIYQGCKALGSALVTANLNPKYVANISPYGTYKCYTYSGSNKSDKVNLPGSFGYLMSLARSIRTNPNYLAIAGVTRGLVPNLLSLSEKAVSYGKLTNKIANTVQPQDDYSINCITDVRPYGLTIWGNRTLADNKTTDGLTASSFLNLRNLIYDVKKKLYTSAKSLMFEQNSDILWVRFKSMITPLLDSMKYGQGIKDYKLTKIESKTRGKLQAEITLYPIYAVEEFDITVVLTDDDVTVE